MSLLYDLLRVLRIARCTGPLSSESTGSFIGKWRIFRGYNEYRRRKIKNDDSIGHLILYFVEDVLYFLVVALIVVLLFYGFNWGKARLFSVVALFFGFFAWRYTVGWIVLHLFEWIFYFVGALVYFLLYPFTFFALKIKKVIYKSFRMIYNKYDNDKKVRRKKKEEKILHAEKEKMKQIKMHIVVMERK